MWHEMELTQLQTFAAVARESSITRAAERLHLSQPVPAAEDQAGSHHQRRREEVTRQLIVAGTGIGLLHAETAAPAQASREVELLLESALRVQVRFAHLASRASAPPLSAAVALMREGANGRRATGEGRHVPG